MGESTPSSSCCCWIHPEGFNACNLFPLPCAITCRVSQKILIHRDPQVPLLGTPEFHPVPEGVFQAFPNRICLWKTFGDPKRGFLAGNVHGKDVSMSMEHGTHFPCQAPKHPCGILYLTVPEPVPFENFGKGESNLRPAGMRCSESLRIDP